MINNLEMDLIRRMNVAILGGNTETKSSNIRKVEIEDYDSNVLKKKLDKTIDDELIKKYTPYKEYAILKNDMCEDTNNAVFNVNDIPFGDANITYRYLNTLFKKYNAISDGIIKGYMGDIPKHHLEDLVNDFFEEINNALGYSKFKITLEKIKE